MASNDLKAFLTKLDSELQQDSEEYRRLVGNKKTHIFTYKSSTIRFVLRDLFNRSTGSAPEGREAMRAISKDLRPLITNLTQRIRDEFLKIAQGDPTIQYKLIRGGVSVMVLEFTGARGQRNNYGLITSTYKEALDDFYESFLALLDKPLTRPSSSKKGQVREISTAGEAFNLEHVQGSNIESFLNDAVYNALQETYGDSTVPPELRKELEEFGLGSILEVYKDAETGVINVTIRSQILNAIVGGGREKALAKKLREAVSKLDIPNLEGSDSLVEAKRKKAVNKIMSPFKKKDSLKVKQENTKIKGAKNSSSFKKTPKKSKIKKSAPALMAKKSIKNKKDPEEKRSLFSVMAMINQKLPQTVEKNMGSPGLESQTGRFARSVRLTDVNETRQGFPTFGYTYRKDPYQVFEVGTGKAPWATIQRDPRRVIDASIRELAAQMALGRFYTRRV